MAGRLFRSRDRAAGDPPRLPESPLVRPPGSRNSPCRCGPPASQWPPDRPLGAGSNAQPPDRCCPRPDDVLPAHPRAVPGGDGLRLHDQHAQQRTHRGAQQRAGRGGDAAQARPPDRALRHGRRQRHPKAGRVHGSRRPGRHLRRRCDDLPGHRQAGRRARGDGRVAQRRRPLGRQRPRERARQHGHEDRPAEPAHQGHRGRARQGARREGRGRPQVPGGDDGRVGQGARVRPEPRPGPQRLRVVEAGQGQPHRPGQRKPARQAGRARDREGARGDEGEGAQPGDRQAPDAELGADRARDAAQDGGRVRRRHRRGARRRADGLHQPGPQGPAAAGHRLPREEPVEQQGEGLRPGHARRGRAGRSRADGLRRPDR